MLLDVAQCCSYELASIFLCNMADGNLPQNGANKVYIQGEEESEEQEDPILIATDCKITLRPLLCFGTTRKV